MDVQDLRVDLREYVRARFPEFFRANPDAHVSPAGFPPFEHWLLNHVLVDEIVREAAIYAGRCPAHALHAAPSLLDHEGVHEAPWATYHGDTADPTGIRRALAELRHGREGTNRAAMVIWVLAERAVRSCAAVNAYLPWLTKFSRTPATAADLENRLAVAPVIGWGQSAVPARYEAWKKEYSQWPWFWSDGKRFCDRVPEDGEWLALSVELADNILEGMNILQGADTQSQYEGDMKRLANRLERWRAHIAHADR